MDRCNLTILSEPGHEDLAEFLAKHQVQITASMPCYSPANVDKQRGQGVFDRSIAGLQALNRLGYGIEDSGLEINLVYNPLGPNLPPPQAALEADYKRELKSHFGIEFTRLFTITNMPIQRFGAVLLSQGQFEGYMQLLKDAYRPENLDTVMCRSLLSVDYQGYLYDCDFNQMLQLAAISSSGPRPHLRELLERDEFNTNIHIADHCYGCTAGQGSSCGGALEETDLAVTAQSVTAQSVTAQSSVPSPSVPSSSRPKPSSRFIQTRTRNEHHQAVAALVTGASSTACPGMGLSSL
jgi:radical SAM/Cys-rich protein